MFSFQRNEVGSSTAMEYAAFQQCMDFLMGHSLDISTFVSDRHISIAKHMREKLTNITHYFDLWHLKKSKCRHFPYDYKNIEYYRSILLVGEGFMTFTYKHIFIQS